jgi:hypothetical protein
VRLLARAALAVAYGGLAKEEAINILMGTPSTPPKSHGGQKTKANRRKAKAARKARKASR